MELIIFWLTVAYAIGVVKLWTGFHKTYFTQNLLNRISLSLLWPVLFIANPAYRRNFKRALKN